MKRPVFEFSSIPFAETGRFSSIITDYLKGDTFFNEFISYPFELESFKDAIQAKSKEAINRKLLKEVLLDQYQDIETSEEVLNNINLLEEQTTFCCVTAHQLNILTGPLYIIYKTQSVIDLCAAAEQENPRNKIVPVFWLGSEDHDLQEINHTYVNGEKLKWDTNQTGPTGKMATTGMEQVLKDLEALAGDSDYARNWLAILNKAYSASNLAKATQILLNELFADQGVIVLDADDKRLKAEFAEIMQDELLNQTASEVTNNSTLKLESKYGAQAHVRDINLFYMEPGIRSRIIREDSKYSVADSSLSWTEDELLKLLTNQPQLFSPNVILRPLYQQKILPSLAYIGGGGEIAYWMQLKTLFQHYEVDFPMLVLRSSVMVVDKGSLRKMKKLGITNEAIFDKEFQLIRNYVKSQLDSRLELDDLKDVIKNKLNYLSEQVNLVDPTLEKTVLAEQVNTLKNLEKLEKKIFKAVKRKSDTEIKQIQAVTEVLFPSGSLQERHDNLSSFFTKFGFNFLEEFKGNLNPLDKQFLIATEV